MLVCVGFVRSFRKISMRKATFATFLQTPLQEINLFGRNIYIKRDDLATLPVSEGLISGNKVRKLRSIFNVISATSQPPTTIVSYGGSQSNAMRAIALLVQGVNREFKKTHTFTYCTRKIPAHLKQTPSGNLLTAIQAGTKVRTLQYTSEVHFILFANTNVVNGF